MTDDKFKGDLGIGDTKPETQPVGNIDAHSMKEQERIRYGQNTRFRKHLTRWVMWIVPVWLGFVMLVVIMCSWGIWHLSDTQMVALLTTTTANILGLAYIVLKGMFPPEK